ncbi:hypothetical protein VUN82_13105 [Micrococcaceae bacterium Sec5.1]
MTDPALTPDGLTNYLKYGPVIDGRILRGNTWAEGAPQPGPMPSLPKIELLLRITTDIGFWNYSLRLSSAKAEQVGAPVSAYECQWRTPCFDGMWSPHGVELPFIFHCQDYGAAWDGEDSNEARIAADPNGDRFDVGDKMFEA